jgi:hypothetical protein
LGPHVFQHQSQQLLTTGEVQLVQTCQGTLGEAGDALLEVVGLRQLGPLGEQGSALVFDPARACVELGGSPGHLGIVEKASLVQICHSSALCLYAVVPTAQAAQLGCEQLVVRSRVGAGQRGLTGSDELGAGKQLPHLFKDERVQLVGTDASLGATALLPPRPDQVVVRAKIIAGQAVLPADPVGGQLHAAVATTHQTPEQERVGLCPPRAENCVASGGLLDGLEGLVAHDGRYGDLHPVFSRPAGLTVAVATILWCKCQRA